MAIAVAAMLIAEARGSRALAWIAKPTASTCFVLAAIANGAWITSYGRWVLVALVLSWWGDVLLIPKSQRVFLAGILSFLAAHVAYAIAFVVRGIVPAYALGAGALLAIVGFLAGRYFVAHAPAGLKKAVIAYVFVLSVMVALAIGASVGSGGALIPLAAIAFYFSDMSVAQNRFVKPSLVTRAWGAPLYFAAQLMFAQTVP